MTAAEVRTVDVVEARDECGGLGCERAPSFRVRTAGWTNDFCDECVHAVVAMLAAAESKEGER